MLKKGFNYGANDIDYFNTADGITLPVIESKSYDADNISKLQSLLIDGVFSEGGLGYYSNKNHLVFFNSLRCVVWVNSRGFIHIVEVEKRLSGGHYRIHKTKNTMDVVKDNFYDSRKLIDSCENVIAKKNIYVKK